MNPAPPRPLALGLAAAAVALPLVYAVVRVIEARVAPEQDPAAVISAEHSALLGRLMVSGFITLLASAGTVSLVGAVPARGAHVVGALAVLSAVAVLVQSMVVP